LPFRPALRALAGARSQPQSGQPVRSMRTWLECRGRDCAPQLQQQQLSLIRPITSHRPWMCRHVACARGALASAGAWAARM